MNDTERYDLCTQCIEELPESRDGFKIFIDSFSPHGLIDYVKEHTKGKWSNPLSGEMKYDINSHKWLLIYREILVEELCEGCPYKLEHIALANKELEETETLRGINASFGINASSVIR